MKRIIALFLALVSVFALSACSVGEIKQSIKEEIFPSTTAIPTVRVTFPEGMTVSETALLLEEKGVCSAADFMAAVNAPQTEFDYLDGINNPGERPFLLEGYIFPDTYEFYLNMDPQSVLKRFLVNFERKITDEYKTRAAEMGYTIDEILRIASIIQEEALDPQMKTVSSVLHNRLDSSYGRLECDVTIFYLRNSVAPYVGDVSVYEDLYNAYNFKGLPAGPITNVGISAIEAALYPEETDYYFFLTDKDMNYYYAVTWDEHSKNVDLYIED